MSRFRRCHYHLHACSKPATSILYYEHPQELRVISYGSCDEHALRPGESHPGLRYLTGKTIPDSAMVDFLDADRYDIINMPTWAPTLFYHPAMNRT